VLADLVRKELLSPEWVERILFWRHTGFNVQSLVRTKTKPEAERVGKYMIRPLLALERLTFLEPEGKVGYSWGRDGAEQDRSIWPPDPSTSCESIIHLCTSLKKVFHGESIKLPEEVHHIIMLPRILWK